MDKPSDLIERAVASGRYRWEERGWCYLPAGLGHVSPFFLSGGKCALQLALQEIGIDCGFFSAPDKAKEVWGFSEDIMWKASYQGGRDAVKVLRECGF